MKPTRETHGRTKSSEYGTWSTMKSRCFNANVRGFRHYGGRGITVCPRWRESFEAFLEDMGPRPPGHSIDRKNNDGNYSCGKCEECVANGWPPNCRWATASTQRINSRPRARGLFRRGTRLLEHNGKAMTLAAWASVAGIDRGTLHRRLSLGAPIEAALTPTNPEWKRARALDAIAVNKGNKSRAAAALGIDRTTLYRILGRPNKARAA